MDAATVLGASPAPATSALMSGLDTPSSSSGGGLNIDTVTNAFNAAHQSITDSLSDLAKEVSGASGATAKRNVGIEQQTSGQQELNAIKEKSQMQIEARTKAEAGAFGTDPDASSYVVTAFAGHIVNTEKELSSLTDMMNDKMKVSFMDDPLQFVANQFSLPFDQARAELLSGKVSQESATLRGLMNATTEAAQKNAAIDQSASEARLAATNKVVAGKAIQDVADSDFKMAQLGIQGISVKNAMNEQQFTNILQVNNAKNEATRLSLAQTSEQLHERQVNIMEGYRKLQEAGLNLTMEQRQDQIDAINSIQKNLDRVTSIYGMRKIAAKDFMSPSFPPRMKETVQQLMLDPNTEDGKLGFNATGALNRVNEVNASLTPGMNILRKKLLDIQSGIIAQPMNQQMWRTLTPDQRMAVVQKGIDADVLKEASNVPPTGGIYSPPPLKDVLTTPSLLAAAPILTGAKSALPVIAATDPQHPLNANEVFKSALEAVTTNQATIEQMGQEISRIYKTANALNAETQQYNRFALPALVDTHKTTLYTGVGWGGARNVDMANPIAVQSELIRSLANLKRITAISESP